MASLTYESKTRKGWRLRAYQVGDSARRFSVWLGDLSQREAETIRRHIEATIESQKLGTPMPGETTRWLARIDDRLRRKLAPLLGAARTVREAVDAYLEWDAANNKPSTVRDHAQTLHAFAAQFGSTQMRGLIAADLDHWLSQLNSSTNTVGKHAKNVRTFIAWARRQGWIDDLRIETSAAVGVGDKLYVPPEWLDRWMAAFRRHPEYSAALAIARWSGVRVPSELVLLTRSSIDWENDRVHVPDSKRSHRQSRGPPIVRETPLFPELVDYLRAVWTEGPPTSPLLPTIAADGGAAFVRAAEGAREQLGLRWPRLFTSVRSTRETDLIRRFGLKAACEWIGNSPAVALRHYEQITSETWAESTAPESLPQTRRSKRKTV